MFFFFNYFFILSKVFSGLASMTKKILSTKNQEDIFYFIKIILPLIYFFMLCVVRAVIL
jgi:hypothetical protein